MTWAACLTPPGRAALATVALRGPDAWAIARALFQPRSASGRGLPEAPEPGRVWLGRLGAGDEVVLAVKERQPMPWLEIHGHGGPQAMALALDTLSARGVRVCSWEEFLALVEPDPLARLAAAALAHAPTLRTAAILLDQFQGAFRREVVVVLDALSRGDREEAAQRLDALAGRADLGRHLTVPWQVVLAGPPNVGKSSLLNALAGYGRAIVADTPGTTRDVVTVQLAVDGWPVEAVDTAGVRDTADELEGQGVALALAAAAAADLRLWLIDSSAPRPEGPVEPGPRTLTVLTKCDLPPAWDLSAYPEAPRVSAVTGAGMEELVQRLSRVLVPEPPEPGAGVPFTSALADGVVEARRRVACEEVAEAISLLRALLHGSPPEGLIS